MLQRTYIHNYLSHFKIRLFFVLRTVSQIHFHFFIEDRHSLRMYVISRLNRHAFATTNFVGARELSPKKCARSLFEFWHLHL
jgi:hypothetical protein